MPTPPRRRWFAGLLETPLLLSLVPTVAAAQDTPDPTVSGLTVEQDDGAALLRWNPVEGAAEYEIERTPLEGLDGDTPSGDPEIVGVWRDDRTMFALEQPTTRGRCWARRSSTRSSRPRARVTGPPTRTRSTSPTAWPRPASGCGWRRSVTPSRDAASTCTSSGTRGQWRTQRGISRSPTVVLNCNVHGNEPAGREACLMVARELALSDDPWVIDILTDATVLIVPAINGDGRANNTRGNVTGQDLNRDHSLLAQPETFAFAEALRDYTPDAAVDGHEFGNTNTGDLPLLWPRHLNVSPAIHDEAMHLVRDFHFGGAARDGWWTVPYPFPSVGAGLGQETILRNTLGLKNTLGMLLESRVQAGPTRPNAGGNQGVTNRYRRVYSYLWTYRTFLTYHNERRSDVYDAVAAGRDYNISNQGARYLEGNYAAPDNIPIMGPDPIEVDPAPCGYLLTEEQYTGERDDGPTVQAPLEAHGIGTEVGDDGVLVRMTQPLRHPVAPRLRRAGGAAGRWRPRVRLRSPALPGHGRARRARQRHRRSCGRRQPVREPALRRRTSVAEPGRVRQPRHASQRQPSRRRGHHVPRAGRADQHRGTVARLVSRR